MRTDYSSQAIKQRKWSKVEEVIIIFPKHLCSNCKDDTIREQVIAGLERGWVKSGVVVSLTESFGRNEEAGGVEGNGTRHPIFCPPQSPLAFYQGMIFHIHKNYFVRMFPPCCYFSHTVHLGGQPPKLPVERVPLQELADLAKFWFLITNELIPTSSHKMTFTNCPDLPNAILLNG